MAATKPNETVAPTGKRAVRPQVSILLSQDMKTKVEQVAQEKGCSFGRAAELIFELFFVYRQTVEDMRKTVGSVQAAETKLTETILFHKLWTPIRTTQGGYIWAPPNTQFPVELEKLT
jgi:hypothetical protein